MVSETIKIVNMSLQRCQKP